MAQNEDAGVPKTLLLIEDSFTIQDEVRKALATFQVEVVVAMDAVAGLHQLHAVRPDIIVADASLPEIDGFQLCHIVRGIEQFRHIPVLLLTSNFATYDERRGQQVGVTAHLAKPFTAEVLRETVRQLLAVPCSRTATQRATAEVSEAAFPLPQEDLALQTLGESLIQVVREAVQTQLRSAFAQAMPRLVQAVQEEVVRQLPALLEVLLQREIERLKRTIAAEDLEGEQNGGEHRTPQGL